MYIPAISLKATLPIKFYFLHNLQVYHIFIQFCCIVCQSLSYVQISATPCLQPIRLLYPWDFSGKNIGSGLPFLSPGDLPDPGIEPWSPELQAYSLPTEPPATPHLNTKNNYNDTPVKKKKWMPIQVEQNILGYIQTDLQMCVQHMHIYMHTYTHIHVLSKIFLKIKAYYNRIGYWRESKMQLKIQRGKCSSIKFTTVKEQFFFCIF